MSDELPGLPEIADALGDAAGSYLTGLPAPIQRNTFKALCALITGSAEVGVSWLGMKKAEFDAQAQGHKVVMASLAKNAATQAGKSAALGERAFHHFTNNLFREQENREAVAREAVDALRQLPPSEENKEPPAIDEDWLHQFRNLASSKSNADIQAIFGKILAGEVHKPGSFSPFTLEVLSRLDQQTAQNFEYLASRAIISDGSVDIVILTILGVDGVNHDHLISGDAATLHLMACGLIQEMGMGQLNERGLLALKSPMMGGHMVEFNEKGQEPPTKRLMAPMRGNLVCLTHAGAQLQSIISKTFDPDYARRLRDGLSRLGVHMSFPDVDIDAEPLPTLPE